MKFSKFCAFAAISAAALSSARASVNIVIVGSSAFRAVVDQAILDTLSNDKVAYKTGTGITGSRDSGTSIYQGTVAGISGTVTIQTNWNGSGAGINILSQPVNVTGLLTAANLATATADGPAVGLASPATESKAGDLAFSDVLLSSSAASRNITLADPEIVGVIPFKFLASKDAPATFKNINDQQIAALYGASLVPLSFFTGNDADTANVYATGRSNDSGTRITVLAESGYGISRSVQQYSPTVTAGVIGAVGTAGNTGPNALGVTNILTGTGKIFVGYLGLSDAAAAISGGARELTYNGGVYSASNVSNGSYTLWGYEELYTKSGGVTGDQLTFKTALLSAIEPAIATLGETTAAALAVGNVLVGRTGDGGPVSP